MAHVHADRVSDTSTTTGTGAVTVSGTAPTGYRTFSAVCSTNDTVYYCIAHQTANEWEVGLGTYSASNQITRTQVFASSNSGSAVNLSSGTKNVFITQPAARSDLREMLFANRTYYVRAVIGAPTFTASSANITLTSHGLSVDDPVVLSVLPNSKQFTVTNANPGVVTTASAHGYSAGQPVVFSSTGSLPAGVTAGTTYYVISTGLTSTQFQFSTTPGGAAVNTSKLTFTASSGTGGAILFTTPTDHGLSVGQQVSFSSSGTLPTNISASTTYYVSSVASSTTFYVKSVKTSTSSTAYADAGTGTHSIEQVGLNSGSTANAYGSNTAYHTVSSAGAMPTFSTAGLLVAGTVYYVGTVVDANTITLSTTTGNANPIGTATLATGSPVYSLATGNDNNNGLAATRSGAFLTIGKAASAITTIDFNSYTVGITVADSTYTTSSSISILSALAGYGSSSPITFTGNTTSPGNVLIQMTSGTGPVFDIEEADIGFSGVKIQNSSGSVTNLIRLQHRGTVTIGDVELGASVSDRIYSSGFCQVYVNNTRISGTSSGYAFYGTDHSQIKVGTGISIKGVGIPSFTAFFHVQAYSNFDMDTTTLGGGSGKIYSGKFLSYMNLSGATETSVLLGNANGAFGVNFYQY